MTPTARVLARYRLTPTAYLALADQQGNVCAICRDVNGARPLFVDHDRACCGPSNQRRTCGQCTRGLLCNYCNSNLGLYELGGSIAAWRIENRPGWVAAARAYLHAAGCDPDAPYRRFVLRELHQQRTAALAEREAAQTGSTA